MPEDLDGTRDAVTRAVKVRRHLRIPMVAVSLVRKRGRRPGDVALLQKSAESYRQLNLSSGSWLTSRFRSTAPLFAGPTTIGKAARVNSAYPYSLMARRAVNRQAVP